MPALQQESIDVFGGARFLAYGSWVIVEQVVKVGDGSFDRIPQKTAVSRDVMLVSVRAKHVMAEDDINVLWVRKIPLESFLMNIMELNLPVRILERLF